MKITKKNFRRGNVRDGFSLPEMLIVVAILGVLLSVAFVNGTDMIRNSRQTAMDRQAEQIFLALSRNLQGLDASGNTAFLQSETQRIYEDEENNDWLIQIEAPKDNNPSSLQADSFAGRYALYQTDENQGDAFQGFKSLLFPEDGLSAALSEDLSNGCWLILFTPGMDEIKTNSDSTGSALRIVRPAVHKVFFVRNENAGRFNDFLTRVLNYTETGEAPESVGKSVEDGATHYAAKSERLRDFEGYVGYYGGDSPSLKARTSTNYATFRCDIEDIINAETLTVSAFCEIPDDPDYKYKPVTVTLKVRRPNDPNSPTVELIDTSITSAWPGRNDVSFVLDKLGAGQLKTKDGTTRTWKQILDNYGFIPGEKLQFTLSAVCDNKYETEGSIVKTANSLFGDGSTLDGDALNAQIVYGRHLQNLDARVSGVGANSGVTEIHATQTQDIYFSGPYPDGPEFEKPFDTPEERWADTYQTDGTPKTFLPVTNDKLISYDGGGHTIHNLTVNYEDAAAQSGNINDSYKVNAGLFGTFGGDTIKNLTLTEPRIKATEVTSTEKKSVGGVAGICEATTLQNLTLIDPAIEGMDGVTDYAGGLAGTLSMKRDVTVTQCALYLTSADKAGSMAYQALEDAETPENGMLWLTTGTGQNRYAGGLVGLATGDGKTLRITESFASTVVKAGLKQDEDTWGANCHAGGLVGMAADKVSVDISLCYAGSYLYGAYTGGLVGGTGENASVKVEDSYAAGFQYSGKDGDECACGLVNGTVSEMSRCYSVSALNYNKGDAYTNRSHSTVLTTERDRLTSLGKFNQVWDVQTLDKEYQIHTDVQSKLGDQFESWIELDYPDGINTYAYNLKRQGLLNYTYPRLKNVAALRAYHGDWKPELGILAYYEIYHYAKDSEYPDNLKANAKDTQTGDLKDGEYRFAVESLNYLHTGSELQANRGKITADGYGILFEAKSADLEVGLQSLTVSFGGIKTTGTKDPVWEIEDISVNLNNCTEISIDGVEYILYPIEQKQINRDLHTSNEEGVRTFYQLVKITQRKKGEAENGDPSYYKFNPHFPVIPNMLPNADKSTSLTWNNVRESYLVLNNGAEIPVRTARHLRCLSEYYEKDYYPILRGNGTGVAFKQICDIDYRAYQWDAYAPLYRPTSDGDWKSRVNWEDYATEAIHYNAGSQNRESDDWDKAAFTQKPIAEKQTAPFVNVYDGDCYVITGLSVMADASNVSNGQKTAVGLFGWNAGRLKNIVFAAPFDRDDLNSPYVVGRQRDIGKNNRKEEVYLGALAGYNKGQIDNCAVAGYYLAMSGDMRDPAQLWDSANKSGADENKIRTLAQSTLYAGGFVGYNATDGIIRNASVSAPDTFALIDFSSAYVGGFAGRNDGQISYAYAIGAIEADPGKNTTLNPDCIISLAGFCADGGSGALISHSYCAVSIGCMGVSQHMNGFAPSMVKADALSCEYLRGPVAQYLNELRNYDADDEHDGRRQLGVSERDLRTFHASLLSGGAAVLARHARQRTGDGLSLSGLRERPQRSALSLRKLAGKAVSRTNGHVLLGA